MKVGKVSKLDDLTVTITSSETSINGFPKSNILNSETLKKWKVQEGTVTLTLEFSSISAQAIGIFNIDIEDEITVKTFNSSAVETNSITKTQSDIVGLDSLNLAFELSVTTDIVKIQIITNGTTSTFNTTIGYVWVGDLINFGDLEAFAPTDEGTDDATVTRANSVSTQQKYNVQSFKFTTSKNIIFATMQQNVREILQNGGYTHKRPFIIEDCIYDPQNVILGIFDAGVFQYDLLDPDKDYAQITKGIREVF